MWKEHFDSSGRTPRLRFFIGSLVGQALFMLIVYGGVYVDATLTGEAGWISLAAIAVAIVGIGWTEVVLSIRRLHDLGRSGKEYFMLFVPGYSMFLGAKLSFERGTVGPNRYGPDPLASPAEQSTTAPETNAPLRLKVVAPQRASSPAAEHHMDVKVS